MSDFPAHRFYYLENFERAITWLEGQYAGLLSNEEQAFVRTFATLPMAARALLVRLIMRRGPLFLASKIQYEEIGDLSQALEPLVELKWIDCDPRLTITQVCSLLTKRTLAAHFGIPLSWSKELLRAQLEAQHLESKLASEWSIFGTHGVIEVKIATLCTHLQLLFFGNWHQGWQEFVLSDLGIFKYEPVLTDGVARAFESRAHIDAFYALFQARQALEDGAPCDVVRSLLPHQAIDHEWLEERRAKLQFSLARREERAGDFTLAFDLYAQCDHPGARARAVRVLERQGRREEARCAAERYAGGKVVESERELLQRALRRLLSSPSHRIARRRKVDEIELSFHSWQRVEESAAESLRSPDAPVFYVENLLINGLFGLWCWDVIFAPMPGAFFHPFQRGPADLWSPRFVERRHALMAEAFQQLQHGEHASHILAMFRAKQGTHNPFVFWGGLTEELIGLALKCIPASHLKCLFERMLADLEHNCTGFPDLVQFYPQEQRYRFIEVKGPGDRLQDHQRRWMNYFAEHGIPAMVCTISRMQAAA
jgi:hypothetical protein